MHHLSRHHTTHLLTFIQLYSTVLAFLNVIATVQHAQRMSLHLTAVTLAVTMLYAYRDVWPLMTISLPCVDEEEGAVMWVKVSLLAFVSVVVPLCEPFPYVPVDPKVSLRANHCKGSWLMLTNGHRNLQRKLTRNRPHRSLVSCSSRS